jgi:hypothetical protein
MSKPTTSIVGISQRQPSIDFIDNELPAYHRSFANAPTQYDPTVKRYTPAKYLVQENQLAGPSAMDGVVFDPVRNPPQQCGWDDLYSVVVKHLEGLQPEPKDRTAIGYSIRNKNNWSEVFDVVRSARNAYYECKGTRGFLRKFGHKAADEADKAKQVMGFIPDSQYTSPVLGVLNLIFDVCCPPFWDITELKSSRLQRKPVKLDKNLRTA